MNSEPVRVGEVLGEVAEELNNDGRALLALCGRVLEQEQLQPDGWAEGEYQKYVSTGIEPWAANLCGKLRRLQQAYLVSPEIQAARESELRAQDANAAKDRSAAPPATNSSLWA